MNKYKKLMGNTLIFGIGSFGAKFLGFFMTMLYTRCMTEAEYSTADLLYNTVNVLVPLVTFSMADAVIRFGMDKDYDPRRVFTCANVSVLLGMTIFMLFTPLIGKNETIGSYTFLLYIYCYFSCFRQMASQFVRARGYVKLFAADGILTVLVQVISNLILIWGLKLGVTGYVVSFVVSDVSSLLFLTAVAGLHKYVDAFYIDKKVIGEMLKFSAPLIPTYLLWWVTSASDRWFVINMVGDTENGIYSIAYKLPTLLMLVTTMFYQAWQMSSIEERNSRGLGKFYETVFGAYSSLLYIAAAGLIMLCKPLTLILTGTAEGSRFQEAYVFTPILIISMIFQCFCQFLSSVYTTKKRSVNSCATAFVAAAVNIILNFLLIPQYGVWGAAIATAASYFACFAVRLFDARKFIFFKVDYFRFLVNTVIIVFMCVITAKQPSVYWVGLILGFTVCLVYNFDAIIKTLRKILSRGGRQNENAAQ
ncbi:MAG: polysaccharide biosynthesis C-terminal domain-containing protein [Oscillospiraceae bacterium]|nr:polysaccharide biosynthesis C-terminal domain-containing protein [Oscillospiraceae bacterium]